MEKENAKKDTTYKGWGYIVLGYVITIAWWLTIALFGHV